MATAWEILKANSSLDSGTAWEHLNNQNTGTGEGTVIVDGLEVEMNESIFDVELTDNNIEVYVEENFEFDVEVTDNEFEVEVD